MSNLNKSIAAVLTLLVIMWSVQAMAQLANTPWPKPGKDVENTGFAGAVPVAMPAPAWIVDLPDLGAENQGVIIDTLGNIVFKTGVMASGGSSVMSVNSGGVVWEVVDVGSWDWGTAIAASPSHGDRLYCQDADWGGTGTNSLIAYDTGGNQLWAMPLGAANDSTPVVGTDNIIYAHANSNLYCVRDDGNSYTVLGTVALPIDNGVGPLALKDGAANDDVVFISGDATMVAVEQLGATTWSIKWTQGMGKTWRHPAIGPDGNVYLSHFNDYYPGSPDTLLCFDAGNGNILWSVTTPPPANDAGATTGNHFSLCAIANDTLYFGGHGSQIWAYNTNGTLKWTWPQPEGNVNEIAAQPSVVEDGGDFYIYAPCHDGYLYVLKDETTQASLFWSYPVGSDIAGQVAIGSDGTAYVSSKSSEVIAFQPYPGGVAITNLNLPEGYPTVPYSAQLGAFGGVPPYTFSVVGGALPPGLVLAANGAITGTPTATGAYPVTFQATDTVPVSGTKAFTMNMVVKIVPEQVPDGAIAETYNAQLQGLGATPPNTWLVIGGALPTGVNLNGSTGLLSGTPTAVGTYNFSVQVTDNIANVATKDYTNVNITQVPLDIATLSVHNGEEGVAYTTTTFEKYCGNGGPYTWSQPAGTIPPGLSLSPAGDDYVLSGTPITAGEYLFSIQVTDGLTTQANGYTVTILAAGGLGGGWQLLADDPATWPYEDTLTDPLTFNALPFPTYDNIPWPQTNFDMSSGNGKLYPVGGYGPGDVYNTVTASTYWANRQSHFSIYDPTTDEWDAAYWKDHSILAMVNGYAVNGQPTGYNEGTGTRKPTVGNGTYTGSSQTFTYDVDSDGTVEVFVLAGYPHWSGNFHIYDPDTNEWSLSANCPPHSGGGWISPYHATSLLDASTGIVYDYGGGFHGPDADTFYTYDATTDTWTEMPDGPQLMNGHTGQIIGGKMYLMGGNATDIVQIYDIAGATWSTGATMPAQAQRVPSVAYGSYIITVGGDVVDVGDVTTIQVYNTVTDKFTTSDVALPAARSRHGAEILNGKLYVTGGRGPGDPPNKRMLWCFDDLDAIVMPEKPVIADMARGTMEITFTTNSAFTYRVESSTSAYDYNEANMTWANEVTGIAGTDALYTWTDASPPTAAGSEKYYRVYASDGVNESKADDTVGLKVFPVGLNRNMVSSPFEPYPAPLLLACDQQINGNACWTTVLQDAFQWVVAPSYGTFEDDGTDKFVRTHIPDTSGFWAGYMRIYFEVEGCIGSLNAATYGKMEFDLRMYQAPGDTTVSRQITSYITTYDDCPGHGYLNRAFPPVLYYTDQTPAYPAWVHVEIDLDALVGDPGFSIADIDAITIITPGCDDGGMVGENYIEMKDLKVTLGADGGTSTLDKIIGNQLTGHPVSQWAADQVAAWDASAQTYILAWLRTGQGWRAWDTMDDPPTFGFNADDGYWVTINNSATNLTLFGRVPKTGRTIPLLANRNMVGTCKATSTTLAASDLVNDGFTGHPVSQWASDKIDFWNAAGQTYVGVWYRSGQGWRAWDSMDNPPVAPDDALDPGEGFWLTVNNTPFTWTYPVP